jgi:hypothetical protein
MFPGMMGARSTMPPMFRRPKQIPLHVKRGRPMYGGGMGMPYDEYEDDMQPYPGYDSDFDDESDAGYVSDEDEYYGGYGSRMGMGMGMPYGGNRWGGEYNFYED